MTGEHGVDTLDPLRQTLTRAGCAANGSVRAMTRPACTLALLMAMPAALLAGCGSDSDEVSYTHDVKPIFARRCVTCHFSANQAGLVDLEDPFTVDETPGAINFVSDWGLEGVHEIDIVPYDPDASFLLQKVSDAGLKPDACAPGTVDCARDHLGDFMPRINPGLTSAEKDAIRQWIATGAPEAGWDALAPIFGTQAPYFKPRGDNDPFVLAPEKCAFCHYAGSPDPPDFTQPFDPTFGLVGAPASFRSDLLRVDPGHPETSFLMLKVDPPVAEAGAPPEGSSELGSPMPRNYPALSEAEVDVLRRWILEGARGN
jgi:hypothetical protein